MPGIAEDCPGVIRWLGWVGCWRAGRQGESVPGRMALRSQGLCLNPPRPAPPRPAPAPPSRAHLRQPLHRHQHGRALDLVQRRKVAHAGDDYRVQGHVGGALEPGVLHGRGGGARGQGREQGGRGAVMMGVPWGLGAPPHPTPTRPARRAGGRTVQLLLARGASIHRALLPASPPSRLQDVGRGDAAGGVAREHAAHQVLGPPRHVRPGRRVKVQLCISEWAGGRAGGLAGRRGIHWDATGQERPQGALPLQPAAQRVAPTIVVSRPKARNLSPSLLAPALLLPLPSPFPQTAAPLPLPWPCSHPPPAPCGKSPPRSPPRMASARSAAAAAAEEHGAQLHRPELSCWPRASPAPHCEQGLPGPCRRNVRMLASLGSSSGKVQLGKEWR